MSNNTKINYSFAHNQQNAQVISSTTGQIRFDGPHADLLVNGVSLISTLENINQRLLLISPDLEKLEKYSALREAYNYYKMIENLCFNEKDKK
jgi:hypothetical protein